MLLPDDDLFRTGERCRDTDEFLNGIFHGRNLENISGRRVKILGFKRKNRVDRGRDLHLAAEKRLHDVENIRFFMTGCEVMHGVSILHDLKPEVCIESVIRSTKSMLEMSCNSTDTFEHGDMSWYPKKVGPPVSVSKNESHVGLFQLWQKQMMQISKRLGIEQAKVITMDPKYNSPTNCFETYEDHPDGALMLADKRLRPSGSNQDIRSLGSGQCIGPDISRKLFTMMTSLDGKAFL